MHKPLIVVILVVLLALVACGPAEPIPAPAQASAATIPYPEVPRIAVAEARARWESGDAVIVDVRSLAEFEQAHIPGAAHIPVAEIESRFSELAGGVEIITYCT